MKSLIAIPLFLSFFFFFSFTTHSDSKTFTNPLYDGADPWVFQKGDYYYYCRSARGGVVISKSRFLTDQGESKRIWETPSSGWNQSCLWAPELHFVDGHWYVYYTAGESGPPYIHQRSGVLRSETDDVFSEYHDMGMLYTGDNPDRVSDNTWAIDLTILPHKGRLYAVWSGWTENRDTHTTPQHLYIAEMENPYTMKSLRAKLSSPVEPWETGGPLDLQEGPQILKNGDDVFIVYSTRESWRIDYRLGLLRLKDTYGDLLSPDNWEKIGPVFMGTGDVLGVGHCSFAKSPDRTEDWILYHSKKTVEPGWQRDVRLQPFSWNPDGTPNFGTPIPAGVPIPRPSGEFEIEKKIQTPGY
jgi:GH43 family beta-xylosidase